MQMRVIITKFKSVYADCNGAFLLRYLNSYPLNILMRFRPVIRQDFIEACNTHSLYVLGIWEKFIQNNYSNNNMGFVIRSIRALIKDT